MQISLDDVGTRYKHYVELLELWESGIPYMEQRARFSDLAKKRLTMLSSAVYMLRQQLDVLSEIGDLVFLQRQLINNVPTDAAKIHGGRGTPLPTQTEEM